MIAVMTPAVDSVPSAMVPESKLFIEQYMIPATNERNEIVPNNSDNKTWKDSVMDRKDTTLCLWLCSCSVMERTRSAPPGTMDSNYPKR